MIICIVEDITGICCYGPFDSYDAARNWAKATVINLEWYLSYVDKPF